MRLKLLIFSIVASLATIVACSTEEPFACTLVDSEIVEVGTNYVSLSATINATDFGAIEQVGFMIARQGSDDFEWFPAKRGRVIDLRVEELKPTTSYEYRVFVRDNGDSWTFTGEKFKTLAEGETPTPGPEPEPEPQPEP